MTLSDRIIADFRREAGQTRKVLQAVPGDRMDWRPHDKSMAIGLLASHIAECPGWAGAMLEEEMDFSGMMEGYTPFLAKSPQELMEEFEKQAAAFPALLEGKPDSFLEATWTMRAGEQILMQCPRHEALRDTIIHHVIHHRGQLTVFLRLLDVPVPATYGPTADQEAFA